MRLGAAWVLAAAAVGVGSGCAESALQNGAMTCSASMMCPSGYHCALDGKCWKNGMDPDIDLAMPIVMDFSTAGDLAMSIDMSMMPDDLATRPPDLTARDMAMPDMARLITTAAAVWWSTGGGSGFGNSTGARGNFKIGPTWVAGRSVATSNAVVTFGYFSSNAY